ncbi:hypothetical protein HPP92_013460 [Vanilla planifolia]|uniref:Uncharacterized protein n=1 Tax=Vanilla planifolia TaxID=51239 RepID=A0A835QX23_VANPL|nr:hypothetical protein HPP92_013902 [Vanilla planifolia]KAG0478741.1 hypothetical protein HPP92_013460 [Vanilla planifolia]
MLCFCSILADQQSAMTSVPFTEFLLSKISKISQTNLVRSIIPSSSRYGRRRWQGDDEAGAATPTPTPSPATSGYASEESSED